MDGDGGVEVFGRCEEAWIDCTIRSARGLPRAEEGGREEGDESRIQGQ